MTSLFTVALLALFGCGTSEESHEEDHEPTEGHGEHADEVVLSGIALQNARLRVETLELSPLSAETIATGHIALDPRREARVSAVTAGTMEQILVRPGDRVTARTALATVLSPDLGAAVGAHLSASARLDTASARQERVETLRAGGFSSLAEVAEAEADFTVAAADAEAAEERLRVFGVAPEKIRPKAGEHFSSRFSVRTPIAGEVLAIEASLGRSVAPGDPLFHIGDLDEVWLLVDVYERNLASVKTGAAVSFTTEAYGDEVFTGTIDQIGGWLNPNTRTAEVRVIVANPDHRLKPNMFANTRLALGGDTTSGLVIPAAALQTVEGRPSVFIENEPGHYAAITVKTERLADGRLHVLSGLEPGSKLVVEGAFTLASDLSKNEMGEGHAH